MIHYLEEQVHSQPVTGTVAVDYYFVLLDLNAAEYGEGLDTFCISRETCIVGHNDLYPSNSYKG